MTTEEFSNQFDVLLSESVKGVEFDEYEKSLFLTQAEKELVTTLVSGRGLGESFESTEELRKYLQSLVYTWTVNKEDFITDEEVLANTVSSNSYVVVMPPNILSVVYESVDLENNNKCIPNKQIQVTPVSHDSYHAIKNNPFKNANKNRVLRIDSNITSEGGMYVELVSAYPIERYMCRCIIIPQPIVLADLEDLTIDGISKPQTSELHEALHDNILKIAVQLAIAAKTATTQSKSE